MEFIPLLMQFRTEIIPDNAEFRIDHRDRVMLLGSCFTEYIGNELADHKFKTHSNPFGIVYNPHSMAEQLFRMLEGRKYAADEIGKNEELHYSFDHHGQFSGLDATTVLEAINTSFAHSIQFLKETNRLVITFGTAFAYSLVENDRVVANCHKLPGSTFHKKMLSLEGLQEKYNGLFKVLQARLPDLRIILTVSPVRHKSDGAVANQESKAILHLLAQYLTRNYRGVYYFPAYELMMDDLRDYRWYAEDMIHPSNAAVQYIWQKFSEVFFVDQTRELNEEIEKIKRAVKHRPFISESNRYKDFVRNQENYVTSLKERYPYIDFDSETSFLLNQRKLF